MIKKNFLSMPPFVPYLENCLNIFEPSPCMNELGVAQLKATAGGCKANGRREGGREGHSITDFDVILARSKYLLRI